MNEARLPQVPTGAHRIRFTGFTLIDGTGSAPVHDAEIAIEGSRITYAGARRPDGDAPPNTQHIELQGKTILPGFIDTHLHFGLDLEDHVADINRFESERSLRAAARARKTLLAGVTSARDVGGLDAGLRDAIRHGLTLGPRLHVSIVLLSPTGGHADCHRANGSCAHLPMPLNPIIDTDDDVRRSVRLLMRSGADVIKICTTGGVSSPSDTPDDLGVPAEQVRLIREETARRAHQPVAAHAQGKAGIMQALLGGVASIEHGYGIDDECIDLMLEQDTFLVPTLTTALRMPDPAHVPAYLYEKKQYWSAQARKNVAHAIRRGVKIAMGTDCGVCPHGSNLTELGHLVDLGLTPMQALQAGTLRAAELMRLEADLGSLQTGKLADMVIVDFDPLDDIHRLADNAQVKAIIQAGAVIKDKQRWLNLPLRNSALG